jgi:hypothetical protein
MPKNATTEERLAWHQEHQRHSSCRPIPASLRPLLATQRRKRQIETGQKKAAVVNPPLVSENDGQPALERVSREGNLLIECVFWEAHLRASRSY